MAMLKKTLVAAVACGAIAFAASAFAQAGGAGGAAAAGGIGAAGGAGMSGATAGSMGGVGAASGTGLGRTGTSTRGPAGTTNVINSTLSSGLGTSTNTLANNSLGRTGIGPNSNIGTSNNILGANGAAGANGIGSSPTLGANGTGANPSGNMTGTRLAQIGTTNSLGTSGPAGTTSSAAARAAAPGGAPVTGTGALPAGGTALGGNGIGMQHRHVAAVGHVTHHVVRRLARNYTVRRVTHVRLTTHPFHRGAYAEAISGEIGVGSNAGFRRLGLGNTATPVRGVSSREMAHVDTHERHITDELNRAALQGSAG